MNEGGHVVCIAPCKFILDADVEVSFLDRSLLANRPFHFSLFMTHHLITCAPEHLAALWLQVNFLAIRTESAFRRVEFPLRALSGVDTVVCSRILVLQGCVR